MCDSGDAYAWQSTAIHVWSDRKREGNSHSETLWNKQQTSSQVWKLSRKHFLTKVVKEDAAIFSTRIACTVMQPSCTNLTFRLLLKGHSQLWDRVDLDTSFLTLKISSPQPEIKVHLGIDFNLRSVLFDFQLFTEKFVFWLRFCLSYITFSYLVENSSMDSVTVICNLAKKWYLMRMCPSWLCPF